MQLQVYGRQSSRCGRRAIGGGRDTARELYDHKNDTGEWTNPDRFENVNLVNVVDVALVEELSSLLRESFGT